MNFTARPIEREGNSEREGDRNVHRIIMQTEIPNHCFAYQFRTRL